MVKDELAISVKNVSKDFKLPHEKVSSIKGLFTSAGRKRNRTKSTEIQHALKDISFDIKKGEFFGIVGRNGSGKSTLLKILAGIYQPTKGTVKVNGRLVPFIELGVGFNTELSGRDNVFLNGSLLGFSTREIEDKYDDIVGFAELERFMDQKLKNYSSGMQVRLAFSVATILAQSDILLIDEVLAVGDASFQRKCFEYFSSLKKQKKTVVFVSHDMSAVRQYCDRAVLINKSEIVKIDTANKIAKLYSQLFLEDDSSQKVEEKGKRWGDQRVQYESISVEPFKPKLSEPITIHATVKFKQDIEDAVIGFTVKNSAGEGVLGSNSQIKQYPVIHGRAGDKYKITWRIPNIFNNGKYYIEPAIVHNGNVDISDWWEEATYFEVRKEENTPYITNPDMELEVNKQ